MADYDYQRRQAISERLNSERKEKIEKLSGREQILAQKIADGKWPELLEELGEDCDRISGKPSSWYEPKESACPHQALLDVFVPKAYQQSYLYIIDKLNRFPFTAGYSRRTVRTADYGPQVLRVFELLRAYEKLFFCGENLDIQNLTHNFEY